jgi:hypothetical protein
MLPGVTDVLLAGTAVSAAPWPAAAAAGRLLTDLGATVRTSATPALLETALEAAHRSVVATRTSEAEDWAASGLQQITGRANGPLLVPTGAPATIARGAGFVLELLGGARVDAASLLGQRAQLLGLTRHGSTSAGGAARLIRANDGWFALNLARQSDIELGPALIEQLSEDDPWAAVTRWAADRRVVDIVDRAALLGLAVASLPSVSEARTTARPLPWKTTRWPGDHGTSHRQLRVVNLGALWAAPLCAQLLRQDGHHVIDVESIARPDTGVPAFYSVLHKGHERLTLDLQTDAGHADLARLIREADVVIEASRPRALEEMGLSARTVMTDGRQRVWLRITGHGPDENRIAFGDDAAVAGGLVAWDANGPVFAGDAVADPLTGILGAALVQACIHEGGSWVVDLTMREVARYAASTGAQCYSW